MLHGIDQPNLWHGNTLTRRATYGALFDQAPKTFDVILPPPFGGKEGKHAQKNFAFETSSTQVLFVQDILTELAKKATCAIVLDEGLLFRTNESSFVETKRKLVDECDLWAIVSLPGGVFSHPPRRAKAREKIQPLLAEAAQIKAAVVDLKEQLKRLKKDKVDKKNFDLLDAEIKAKDARDLEAKAADIDAAVFDLKAVNPNAVTKVDERTSAEIIENIETQGRIVAAALGRLKVLLDYAD